jgi:proline dehydrogenase
MQTAKIKQRRVIIPFLLTTFLVGVLLFWFAETWLRHLLLYLSSAAWARSLISSLPIAARVAGRFVAGETVEDAVTATRELNRNGMQVTLDFLGESVSNIYEAMDARDEILRLLKRIKEERLEANVSIKLSQLGLKIDEQLALDNIRLILDCARSYGNKVRIDMEESEVVDITLDIYHALRYEFGCDNVGVVIQSYLYRSEEDVRTLIAEGAGVRLCKGAYLEPPEVAFPEKTDTDRNFVKLMQMLLSPEAEQNGVYAGIATHDEQMIEATIEHVTKQNFPSKGFEFQMLYGIRRDLQEMLVNQGYKMRVYVPYGTAWYPYFVRRLAERPANLWFFVSNLLRS